MKGVLSSAFVLAAVTLAGCTVHQTEAPGLTGPSDLALSMRVTALPDSISQDGGSQSSIQITAFGPDGKPKSALPLRVDMFAMDQSGKFVGQDYGALSARTLVTNSSGVATVVYTAPPAPTAGLFGTCQGLPGNCVEIVATASGLGFETVNPQRVTIRLVPPGVIQPPASTPTAAFTFSPQPVAANVPLLFDASASQVGNGASQITSYSWTFGDGTAGTGKTVTHKYGAPGSYIVILTVTNDRTLSSSTTQSVSVGGGAAPIVDFVFSPSAPVVNQPVNFDATQARAGAGHSIASYAWNFGDGSSKTGVTTTHDYGSAGTYNVTLTVTDEAGQATTVAKAIPVVVGGGGGGGATTAKFTFSPSTPSALQSVFFNASTSSASTGHTLTTYEWDFGDGSVGSGVSVTHVFTAAGTYTVTLTVTEDSGQKGTTSTPVTVAAAGSGSLTAEFSISPTNPVSGQLVTFNANLSSPQASIASYDWDFGDGTVVNNRTCNPIGSDQGCFIINHTYFTPTGNIYNIRLTVHDNTGRVATVVHSLPVLAGTDPVASFTISQSPTTVGTLLTFDGALSTVGGGKTIVRYTWDFGDGSPIVSTNAPATTTTHSYAVTGTYVIRLTVTDSAGLTGSTTRTLLVQ